MRALRAWFRYEKSRAGGAKRAAEGEGDLEVPGAPDYLTPFLQVRGTECPPPPTLGNVQVASCMRPMLRRPPPPARLQNALNPSKLTRDEAARADQQCRKALRERLIERVNIIQKRLDEENEKLMKKQQLFQRTREHVLTADEQFEKDCAEAMFRIGILEQRLARQVCGLRACPVDS